LSTRRAQPFIVTALLPTVQMVAQILTRRGMTEQDGMMLLKATVGLND